MAGKNNRIYAVRYLSNFPLEERDTTAEKFRKGDYGAEITQIARDSDVVVMGLWERGLKHAGAIRDRLEAEKQAIRSSSLSTFHSTFYYSEVRDSGGRKKANVTFAEDYLRLGGMTLFIDESAMNYSEKSPVDFELAKKLIKSQDFDSDPKNAGEVEKEGLTPFSIQAARFVLADPFKIYTVPQILKQEFKKGTADFTYRDLGQPVTRFVRHKLLKTVEEFLLKPPPSGKVKVQSSSEETQLPPYSPYIVIEDDDDSLYGISMCLQLREQGKKEGNFYTKKDLLDEEKSRKIFNGGGKKLILLGNYDNVIDKITAAKKDDLIADFTVLPTAA